MAAIAPPDPANPGTSPGTNPGASLHGVVHRALRLPAPLALDSGVTLADVDVAYQSYGTLNPAGDNAILVCHALTMDQYVASPHPLTGKPGWWSRVVGPGLAIDTDRYCVICANVLSSCMGSTGPASIDPATGAAWGMRFPVVTIADMVRAQMALLDALGVTRLHAVVGGSMGGMLALTLAAHYPARVARALVIASAARHSAQNIAFHEVGRQAIMADLDWQGGAYYLSGRVPSKGLSVARMAAHITYLSEAGLTEKFGRRLQNRADGTRGAKTFGFDADFQVESYLRHQGISFVDRFDANSYLYITRAMDYFDLAEPHPTGSAGTPHTAGSSGTPNGTLAAAFAGSPVRYCLISFDSDWLYPTAESRRVVSALNAAGARASFVELASPFGHDAFLLDVPELWDVMTGFLGAAA